MISEEKFIKLMEEYKEIFSETKEKTFLDISGYPHYELVCSNILYFFFDTTEEHGLGDLFLSSLLNCAQTNFISKGKHITEYIETEYRTNNENRIDILIESDRYAIGIENKIRSGTGNNDFLDYQNAIEEYAVETGKEAIYILLTIMDEQEITESNKFVNVTYENFFHHIKENLGKYIDSANAKWILFLKDFISTIESEMEGTDLEKYKEEIEFFDKYREDIDKLFTTQKEITRLFKKKRDEIIELIERQQPSFEINPYNDKLHADLSVITNLAENNEIIYLGLCITTRNCIIYIGTEGRADTENNNKIVGEWIAKNNLKSVKSEYFWGTYHELETTNIYESSSIIADKFLKYINLLK